MRKEPRTGTKPAIAIRSSDWPFPATPAIPTISPVDRKADIAQSRGGKLLDFQHPHQGRLPGAVLTDDPMNGAARNRKVDPVIRPDRAEALVGAAALDGGRRLLPLRHGSAGRIRPAMISARAASALSRIAEVTSVLLLSSIAYSTPRSARPRLLTLGCQVPARRNEGVVDRIVDPL